MTSLFICLGLFSPWLIWNTYLLYHSLNQDKSFHFIILSTTQLLCYWSYIILFLLFGIYLFFVRLYRITLNVNVYEISNNIITNLTPLSYLSLMGLVLVLLLLLIFWLLLLRNVYKYFRKLLYSLYLYYYQYNLFRKFVRKCLRIDTYFTLYLSRRVKIFTSREDIIGFALLLWPGCVCLIEKNLFRYFIPYVIIFDFITQNGTISHVFALLPWFYIYTIIRSSISLLDSFFGATDLSFVEYIYGLK